MIDCVRLQFKLNTSSYRFLQTFFLFASDVAGNRIIEFDFRGRRCKLDEFFVELIEYSEVALKPGWIILFSVLRFVMTTVTYCVAVVSQISDIVVEGSNSCS